MRTIRFRAWHTVMKQMFTWVEMTRDQMALLPDGRFCNVHGDDTSKSTFPPMIPMMFTGLLDKNGKEIYEGDIISIPDDYDSYGWMAGEKREVYFAGGCFRLKPKDNPQSLGHTLETDMDKCEIIGNIHENPELLNVK